MAVRTKTTIFNAALLRTGHSDVTEGQGSGLWRALEANYDEIVRAAFEDGAGTFPFGKVREILTGRSAGNFGFDDSYTIPSGVIHVIEVYLNDLPCSDLQEPWEIDGQSNALLINAKTRTVAINGLKEGLEHTWSAAFTLGVQRKCEAVIKDVEEESEESAAKDQDADYQLLKAGVKGAKNRSKRQVWKKGGGRLIRARRTRSTRGRG
jgi:hypothetical protein